MTTTTDNMARALRAVLHKHDDTGRKHWQYAPVGTLTQTCAEQARAALADYDRAAPVVSAADVAHPCVWLRA